MKRVLVIGENSYIGKSFEMFVEGRYEIKLTSSRNDSWKDIDFSDYDSVLHCAGIAHIKQKKKMQSLYHEINCSLAVEVAKKAKASGINQFIFLSSMAVYGTSNSEIDINTFPNPNKNDLYGISKLEAEYELKKLENENFSLCIVRPPMVYGKGCKGNFPKLVKLARVTPLFPDYPNKRSMIYIDNLCSFLCGLIDEASEGIFLPQNNELVNTTELVCNIARCYNKHILTIKLLNPLIRNLIKLLPTFQKLFGDLYYTRQKNDEKYIITDLKNSVSQSIFDRKDIRKGMKKVMLVFGTRPEAIKMCPLVKELKTRKELNTVVCVTGQHRQMLDQVLDCFEVKPDYDLSIMKDKQTLFDITVNILQRIREVLEKEKPDVVLVHGDTSTTFVTALTCFYMQIPVGHVEAGLRTYNIYSPYPEEFNRQAVGIVAEYNFAPTETSQNNLIREGKNPERIYVTGNTAIDALKTTVREDYKHPVLDWAKGSRLIVLTAHRRENLGEPLYNMFRAIKRIIDENDDVKVVYPIHMNPVVRNTASEVFGDNERIRIIEPLDVLDFHNLLARSYLILTDSGGIQEEAPSLGKPVLVMRDTTERPEGIAAGTLKLVGTDEQVIYDSFKTLLTDSGEYEKMSKASNPYGDGHACERIADILSC